LVNPRLIFHEGQQVPWLTPEVFAELVDDIRTHVRPWLVGDLRKRGSMYAGLFRYFGQRNDATFAERLVSHELSQPETNHLNESLMM
jgi:hypothetical protein